MNKYLIVSGIAVLLIFMSLSGCTTSSSSSDPGTCCVAGFIFIVIFILLIAYLLGHKGTRVDQHIVVPSQYQSESDRHCPACGRSIPFDAKRCPYCSKNFEED